MPNMNSFTPKYRSCVFMAFFGFDHLQSQVCKISKTFDISSFPFNTIADIDFHFFFTHVIKRFLYTNLKCIRVGVCTTWLSLNAPCTLRVMGTSQTRSARYTEDHSRVYAHDCIGEVVRKNSSHIKNKII